MTHSDNTKLRLDDVRLANWLTSNPQHFNSRNSIKVSCGDTVMQWYAVPEGVFDPADRPMFIHRITKGETTPFQKIIDAIMRSEQKRLPKPDLPPDTD